MVKAHLAKVYVTEVHLVEGHLTEGHLKPTQLGEGASTANTCSDSPDATSVLARGTHSSRAEAAALEAAWRAWSQSAAAVAGESGGAGQQLRGVQQDPRWAA